MNAYQALRQRARAKRDETFRDTQSEYKQTLRRIETIEKSLGRDIGKQTIMPEPEVKRLMDLILEVAPKDRVFTIMEVIELLRDCHEVSES